MKVQDVMRQRPTSCRPESNLAEAVEIMWEGDCGSVPIITEDGKLLGIITDRDVAIAVGTQNRLPSDILVLEAISEQVFSCTPDQDIHDALKTMRNQKVRRLPVVNQNGMLEGLLSINDLALRADKLDGPRNIGLTYHDVISTLKAISEHRNAHAATESRSASS